MSTVSTSQAIITTLLAAIAGIIAALPLYTTFWWWDILAHSIAGISIVMTMLLVTVKYRLIIVSTAFIAVGWEIVEPILSTSRFPITFMTGDWVLDILVTMSAEIITVLILMIYKIETV